MDPQAQVAVLVADDDPALRLLCRVNLELEGYRVLEATSAADVERALGAEDGLRAVLLDVHLGTDNGLAVAKAIRATHPEIGVALFTGSMERSGDWRGVAEGFLSKPFTLEDLSATVRRLVQA
jgi:DNA-binding NtrC family response regulator